MAPRVWFEQTTLRLTAECSAAELTRNKMWRWPILPSGRPLSTFGARELNFCVRYGNRWILSAIITTMVILPKISGFSFVPLPQEILLPVPDFADRHSKSGTSPGKSCLTFFVKYTKLSLPPSGVSGHLGSIFLSPLAGDSQLHRSENFSLLGSFSFFKARFNSLFSNSFEIKPSTY